MLRLRRYRVFVALSVILLFVLYRTIRNTDSWDGLPAYAPKSVRPDHVPDDTKNPTVQNDEAPRRPVDHPSEKEKEKPIVKIPNLKPGVANVDHDEHIVPTTVSLPKTAVHDDSELVAEKVTMTPAPVVNIPIPDRKTPQDAWNKDKNEGLVVQYPGAGLESEVATTTTVHWSKQPERFPIAPGSLIPLPSEKPKSIPKIQYDFKQESPEAREKREARLAKVKAEAKRAWSGYRKYAWMHDEMSPVSKKFRDPFCGWAATLVDSLDTLWIMNMTSEFEEAVEALANIDFTYSAQRNEIPVFETTIRYLGGLLGAWDVSDHNEKYKILVDKAVELAEILMGVFDTPNRMPVLYYDWKPESALQPKRAGNGVSVAELGSLSMEFTRLAQVTKKNKYYDAVARITDALEEWQNRGTSIPGIFPERVDATGCNRTAANDALNLLNTELANKGKIVVGTPEDYTGREYSSKPQAPSGRRLDSEFIARPADKEGQSATGEILRRRSSSFANGDENARSRPSASKTDSAVNSNSAKKPKGRSPPDIYQEMMTQKVTGQPYELEEFMGACYPQGLAPGGWGSDSYSMGGSQDSTYEYFPKQYLLLGGLEPKYRTMHLKVVDAVRKWLLYRPMLPDDRDVLFSAKVATRGNPSQDLVSDFEVTHLTCFLGGMFGLGGKIFDDKIDVEIGKKLTDGCVWAYESMPTGIMPEGAILAPCAEVNNCHWNETLYWQYLDPLWDVRDQQIADWEVRVKELRKETAKILQEQKQEELRRAAEEKAEAEERAERARKAEALDADLTKQQLAKRLVKSDAEEEIETSSNDNINPTKTQPDTLKLEDSLNMNVAGGVGKVGAPVAISQSQTRLKESNQVPLAVIDEPPKPMTHEEYVQMRLKNENIPPGYVSVNWRHYILRPEAIESVWYMYRITGDKTWQDKGWKMFEAIIAATQTESGHSAIDNVMAPNPDKTDEMESFWLAETLKYFYLLFSAPDVISLDEYVLNTEAHPFKRPFPS